MLNLIYCNEGGRKCGEMFTKNGLSDMWEILVFNHLLVLHYLQAFTEAGTSQSCLMQHSFLLLSFVPCKCFYFCSGQKREVGWQVTTTWHFIAQLSQEWQNLLKRCRGINVPLPATELPRVESNSEPENE